MFKPLSKSSYLLGEPACPCPSWFCSWWRICVVLGVTVACVSSGALLDIHKPCFIQLNCSFLTTVEHYWAWGRLSASARRVRQVLVSPFTTHSPCSTAALPLLGSHCPFSPSLCLLQHCASFSNLCPCYLHISSLSRFIPQPYSKLLLAGS